jgi:hypothetical protein
MNTQKLNHIGNTAEHHGDVGRGIFNLNNLGSQDMRETTETGKYADGFAEGFQKGGEVEGGRGYNAGVQNGYVNGSVVVSHAMLDVVYTMRLMHPQQRRIFLELLASITDV